jgi:hypothetical protein
MRHLTRPFWVLIALLFLLEAWLWDHLEPIAAWLVAHLPLRRLKLALAGWIEHLHPMATLVVFLLPGVLLFPFKLLGIYLLAQGHWASAVIMFVMAKFIGLGFAAFVFDVTRGKLLQMAWFCAVYDSVIAWRDWARDEVRPIQRRVRALMYLSRPRRTRKLIRRLVRLRRRMNRPATA